MFYLESYSTVFLCEIDKGFCQLNFVPEKMLFYYFQ